MTGELNFGYDGLAELLTRQLDRRGWSQRELARRARMSHTTVSKVLSGRLAPSYEFCRAVAGVLGLPRESVLRWAGLLPALADDDDEAALRELMALLRELSPAGRDAAQRYIRFLAQNDDAR